MRVIIIENNTQRYNLIRTTIMRECSYVTTMLVNTITSAVACISGNYIPDLVIVDDLILEDYEETSSIIPSAVIETLLEASVRPYVLINLTDHKCKPYKTTHDGKVWTVDYTKQTKEIATANLIKTLKAVKELI